MKGKNIIKAFLLFYIVVNFSSCATIFSTDRQKINFISTPDSATIYVNEVKIGVTPMVKKLKRNQEYNVKIELEGYKSYNTNISKGFNGMFLGNLIFGGIIGMIIDASTGSINSLNPKVIETTLELKQVNL